MRDPPIPVYFFKQNFNNRQYCYLTAFVPHIIHAELTFFP